MKNVPVTKEALASLIKSVLDQARIADPTYTATTNDYINAINKIGDVVSFEYEVPTELTWIDGEKMPEGSTIEEIIEDFPMPLPKSKNGANCITDNANVKIPTPHNKSLRFILPNIQ